MPRRPTMTCCQSSVTTALPAVSGHSLYSRPVHLPPVGAHSAAFISQLGEEGEGGGSDSHVLVRSMNRWIDLLILPL